MLRVVTKATLPPVMRGRVDYDYHVILNADGSTHGMKLPLKSYSTQKDVNIDWNVAAAVDRRR